MTMPTKLRHPGVHGSVISAAFCLAPRPQSCAGSSANAHRSNFIHATLSALIEDANHRPAAATGSCGIHVSKTRGCRGLRSYVIVWWPVDLGYLLYLGDDRTTVARRTWSRAGCYLGCRRSPARNLREAEVSRYPHSSEPMGMHGAMLLRRTTSRRRGQSHCHSSRRRGLERREGHIGEFGHSSNRRTFVTIVEHRM